MAHWVMPKRAAEVTGVSVQTLRVWAKAGTIPCRRTGGNTRQYDVSAYMEKSETKRTVICYCRVPSTKQRAALQQQIDYLTAQYPVDELIRDFGSSISFRRKGLNEILDRAMAGEQLEVVIAHKDRLARFGYDLIERIIKRSGGRIVTLDKAAFSPIEELTQDLLSTLYVFARRLLHIQKYVDAIKAESTTLEDSDSSDTELII